MPDRPQSSTLIHPNRRHHPNAKAYTDCFDGVRGMSEASATTLGGTQVDGYEQSDLGGGWHSVIFAYGEL